MSIEEQQEFLKALEEKGVSETRLQRINAAYASTTRENLLEVMEHLYREGFNHITTITAVDKPENYELVYHLRNSGFA